MPKKNSAQGSRSRNREATEQRLLDACERILLSHGPEGIGVNKVVEEAGVGKQLLYRYFDGLPGLVAAWLERGANWPTAEELVGDRDSFEALTYRDKVKSIQRNYLKALRKRPVITRLMASELMNPTEVTGVLESASDEIGRELAQLLADLGEGQQDDLVDLSLLFYCLFNYLAMRSVTSPRCFGMNLKQKKSWERIDGLIDTMVDRYLVDV
jgi:AcrR family transcriptional regulator